MFKTSGDFLNRQAAEKFQFNNFGLPFIERGKAFECFVQGEDFDVLRLKKLIASSSATIVCLPPRLFAIAGDSVIDQNLPHRTRRDAEKMRAALPRNSVFFADEPQIGFVNERGRLQSVVSAKLAVEQGGRERMKLVINKRQKFFECLLRRPVVRVV